VAAEVKQKSMSVYNAQWSGRRSHRCNNDFSTGILQQQVCRFRRHVSSTLSLYYPHNFANLTRSNWTGQATSTPNSCATLNTHSGRRINSLATRIASAIGS